MDWAISYALSIVVMVVTLPGLRMDSYGVFAIVVVYKVGVSNTQETTFH